MNDIRMQYHLDTGKILEPEHEWNVMWSLFEYIHWLEEKLEEKK
jgi:hypothetical protein